MGKKLDEIKQSVIEDWRIRRKKDGLKDSTINRDFQALRPVLKMAIELEFLAQNPFENIKLSREDSLSAPRYLSEDEEKRLFVALDARDERMWVERDSANEWREERGYEPYPSLREIRFVDHLKPMIVLSLHTGMRRGELFALEWKDANLKGGFITIHGGKAKSGKTRHLPLNAVAKKTLAEWKEQTSSRGLVFKGMNGRRFDNVNKAWAGVLEEAEIESFRWHDLRHDFASKLVTAGVDLNTVRELLGHGDIKMTLRYAHLALHVKAEAVEILAKDRK